MADEGKGDNLEEKLERNRDSGRDRRERRRERDRSKDRDGHGDRDKNRERDRDRHHHHHRSSHHHRERSKDRDSHRDRGRRDKEKDRSKDHKKRRHHDSDDDSHRRHRKSRRSPKSPTTESPEDAAAEGEWIEPPAPAATVSTAGKDVTSAAPALRRDSWMMEPTADQIDYTQRGARKPSPQALAKPDYQPIIHKNELNTQLREGKRLEEYVSEKSPDDVNYKFGDSGSNWRLAKLKRVYEAAKEEGRSVEELAMERYGDLKFFDHAREEETELSRREMYGEDRNDRKEKPTGDLYRERLQKLSEFDSRRKGKQREWEEETSQGTVITTAPNTLTTKILDQTSLNKLKASLLKAQLRNDPKASEMEKEYNEALQASLEANRKEPEVVVLSAMDSRMLAGLEGRVGREVIEGKKGKLVQNDEMTLEDMVREERRTRGQVPGGEGRLLAERIAKDAKFDDNLDYLDENAAKLAQRIQKKEISLKDSAINEFKKTQRILDSCPLCQSEDKPPLAPVISTGTRVFLTLPTEPELSQGGAVIVPIQHRANMLECDDDEWEEVRNFMKSLIRMYRSQDRDVIFYENAAAPQRRRHAAIVVVPVPLEAGELAPAYFKEAIMSSDEEWSQHKKLIDTLSKARKEGLGKQAFRRSLVKQMPYFHVWFEIDGGLGHIVEDENRWPKGDLFAREVIGGMLDVGPDVVRRQGRWRGGGDRRVGGFRKSWDGFDWTKVLLDAV
ncbi:Pre-mRNA-splicing factor cwf19 [Rhizina undulata]